MLEWKGTCPWTRRTNGSKEEPTITTERSQYDFLADLPEGSSFSKTPESDSEHYSHAAARTGDENVTRTIRPYDVATEGRSPFSDVAPDSETTQKLIEPLT